MIFTIYPGLVKVMFISFNPFDVQFVELERAFFNVAETVVNKAGRDAEKEYLIMWQRWLKK